MRPASVDKLRPLLVISVAAASGLLLLLGACDTEEVSAPEIREPEAHVQIGEMQMQGILSEDKKVASYLGLPYAQAPVSELRWASPQAFEYSKPQRFDATAFAPACEQGPHIVDWYRKVVTGFGGDPAVFPAPEVSEDCLYLNVWHPVEFKEKSLPVIVYIHGGSHKGGWSYEPNYLGENLARQGVVVVSVAYRLGALGYLSHPEMDVANVALEDLMLALQWLQQYGTVFGADLGNVTLMGESAGANNIAHLMAMPRAKGLFQRAIHQSAGWAVDWSASPEVRQSLAVKLQEKLGAKSLAQMRKLPASEVREAAATVFAEEGFEPVIDGASLPQSLSEWVAAGKQNGIDLLIGSNADEWRTYLQPDQTLANMLEQDWPKEKHAALLAALSVPNDDHETLAMNNLASARDYHCPSMVLAEMTSGQSWVYYFSKVRSGVKATEMGAYHGAELPYVFDTHDNWIPTNASDRVLTRQMMKYWVNFARSGNPNASSDASDLPQWPPYKNKQQVLFLDEKIKPGTHPAAALCKIIYNENSKNAEAL